MTTKTEQLQIRVSPEQKARIQKQAARAGMDVSKWILHQALPPAEERFQTLCRDLAMGSGNQRYVLAELNDFLSGLGARAFGAAVAQAPEARLPAFEAAYVAAMVERAAAVKRVPMPAWTGDVGALEKPWFASALKSLRLYLLTASPPSFRRRNLFIDSSIGDRL